MTHSGVSREGEHRMSPVSKTVDEAAGLIRQRLKELDAERSQLERALSSLTDGARATGSGPARWLGDADHAHAPAPAPRRHPLRPGGEAGRRQPGISASEMAKRMNIKPNYLYRVMAVSRGRCARTGAPTTGEGLDRSQPRNRLALVAELRRPRPDPLARSRRSRALDDQPLYACTGSRR